MKQYFAIWALWACNTSEKTPVIAVEEEDVLLSSDWDADGDGYLASEDCNDGRATINPGAPEICDGLDNNCDGQIDEGVLRTFYEDDDGDGFGNANVIEESCEAPDGMVYNGSDCDDNNETIYPGAIEICDGLDNNCDEAIDENLGTMWYEDADRDGYGSMIEVVQSCTPLEGYISRSGDCDDSSDAIYPGAIEDCDNVDNNCNGEIDETGSIEWYVDADEDGYGDPNVTTYACTQPTGYVDNDLDCDDINPLKNPDATEICDNVDNNCNGILDDNAVDGVIWYIDSDSDGFGSNSQVIFACAQPIGYSANFDDCDDNRFETSPVALEFCNGIDDDCDGSPDELSDVVNFSIFYTDGDGDGFGNPYAPIQSCAIFPGVVSNNQDCNDSEIAINPNAIEYCNDIDDNCNTVIDEVAVDQNIYYLDADGDGYGGTTFQLACEPSQNYITQTGDCDDGDAAVFPGTVEVCDALDNDCDGAIDEHIATSLWFLDNDGDGYGNPYINTYNCLQPVGYVGQGQDCDDLDVLIHPNATEICNGLDDNCDGSADSGFLGRDAVCIADSCLDILNAHPTAVDDQYLISGLGWTECDMGSFGGGWTQVFEDDMSPPDPGWTMQTTTVCGIWGEILGGYGVISGGSFNNNISTHSVPHSEVWLEMDYITLDSWDDDQGPYGPDHAFVRVNNNTIWDTDINNHLSIYGQVCGWWRPNYPQGSYDSRHYVSTITSGTFSSVLLTVGSTLSQGPLDESFGLDDVYVWVRQFCSFRLSQRKNCGP